jgi:hypothetical protein
VRRPAPHAALHPAGRLVNTMDPKLVAAAFGMNPEGVMIYLADTVHKQYFPQRGDNGAETKK